MASAQSLPYNRKAMAGSGRGLGLLLGRGQQAPWRVCQQKGHGEGLAGAETGASAG